MRGAYPRRWRRDSGRRSIAACFNVCTGAAAHLIIAILGFRYDADLRVGNNTTGDGRVSVPCSRELIRPWQKPANPR